MNTSMTPPELSHELRPQLPHGDNPAVASEIGNFAIVQVNALSEELAHFAAARFNQAPASARHVNDLQAALAHAALGWITRWPS